MNELSMSPQEKSRKIVSTILKAIEENGKQTALATAMGVADSTITRMKGEVLDNFALMLAHSGLRVVPASHICVSPEMFHATTTIVQRAMADPDVARKLLREEE